MLDIKGLHVLNGLDDVDHALGAADIGEGGLALSLGEVEDGYGSEGPVSEDGGGMVGWEDFESGWGS